MSKLLRISEAASLALHTVALLAADPHKVVTTEEIASTLKASEAHLSKVLQRLAKTGLVTSIRGPRGGFLLGKPRDKISLLAVYEAIEGPLRPHNCLLGTPICNGRRCILGGLLQTVDKQVRECLAGTKLTGLSDTFRSSRAREEKLNRVSRGKKRGKRAQRLQKL
jgi:Rrf2 family protein